MPTASDLRVLGPADLEDLFALTALDPVPNVFAECRARLTRLDPRWMGGEMWGRYRGDRLVAACHAGANLVPVQCSPEDARLFATWALRRPRTASTLVGPRPAVAAMWEVLAPAWTDVREARWHQPHLVIDRDPIVAPDPLVRRTRRADLDLVYPACVAMYTEEVGVDPEIEGGRDLYRTRVTQLISRGWSFARIEDDRVVFKAEVSSATPDVAQIQGVWVHPERRGEGLAVAGMAAVVAEVRREVAPVVSLYVNSWNAPARRAYERVGFVQSGEFATVMF